jgi:hypothetical protein
VRSTLEIIIAVKECAPVTEEELKLALIVMCNVEHFVRRDLTALAQAVKGGRPSVKLIAASAEKTLESMFYARKKDPAEWLGPADTPGTEEFRRRYAGAKALLARVEEKIARDDA